MSEYVVHTPSYAARETSQGTRKVTRKAPRGTCREVTRKVRASPSAQGYVHFSPDGWEWTLPETFSWYTLELAGLLLMLTGVGWTDRACIKCSAWSDHVRSKE